MDHHLRIKVQVAESNDDEPTPTTRPLIQQAHPAPVLFRESAFSRPILPATSSLLLPPPPKPRPAPGPPAPGPERYRECLRNHAASLGAHVVDGCGEFMPWGPADPLRCAACGCHRSFHRKEQPEEPETETETETEAPLLAPPKSSRESSSEEQRNKQKQKQQKKRFRSKFSGEQKGKMAAFAERVGWRLQKKDESDTERFCRDVGVSTRVLKVWMHNNKHLNIRGSKLRPDQDQDDEEEEEEVQQQYYQPQPDHQPLGEEKKTTKK